MMADTASVLSYRTFPCCLISWTVVVMLIDSTLQAFLIPEEKKERFAEKYPVGTVLRPIQGQSC